MTRDLIVLSGRLLDDDTDITLRELCNACSVNAELVMEMVSEGVLEPRGTNPTNWHFGGTAVVRVQTAIRLQRDLRLNMPGAALVLELLEELEGLRRQQRQYRY